LPSVSQAYYGTHAGGGARAHAREASLEAHVVGLVRQNDAAARHPLVEILTALGPRALVALEQATVILDTAPVEFGASE
jgi:succinate dehydrogenase/fumarate reductase flavoprotein subunit